MDGSCSHEVFHSPEARNLCSLSPRQARDALPCPFEASEAEHLLARERLENSNLKLLLHMSRKALAQERSDANDCANLRREKARFEMLYRNEQNALVGTTKRLKEQHTRNSELTESVGLAVQKIDEILKSIQWLSESDGTATPLDFRENTTLTPTDAGTLLRTKLETLEMAYKQFEEKLRKKASEYNQHKQSNEESGTAALECDCERLEEPVKLAQYGSDPARPADNCFLNIARDTGERAAHDEIIITLEEERNSLSEALKKSQEREQKLSRELADVSQQLKARESHLSPPQHADTDVESVNDTQFSPTFGRATSFENEGKLAPESGSSRLSAATIPHSKDLKNSSPAKQTLCEEQPSGGSTEVGSTLIKPSNPKDSTGSLSPTPKLDFLFSSIRRPRSRPTKEVPAAGVAIMLQAAKQRELMMTTPAKAGTKRRMTTRKHDMAE